MTQGQPVLTATFAFNVRRYVTVQLWAPDAEGAKEEARARAAKIVDDELVALGKIEGYGEASALNAFAIVDGPDGELAEFDLPELDEAPATPLQPSDIPASFPIQPLESEDCARYAETCGTCGLVFDNGIARLPAGHCPFEQFHRPAGEARTFAHTPDTCPSKHWNDGTDTCADCGADLA